MFYHGTSSFRIVQILKEGLKPQPLESRIWNKNGFTHLRPKHRATSVYLTVSMGAAYSFAIKASSIDSKRHCNCSIPIVLRIPYKVLDQSRFFPDDDYLWHQKRTVVQPGDWLRSIKETHRIAYNGTIPPLWF